MNTYTDWKSTTLSSLLSLKKEIMSLQIGIYNFIIMIVLKKKKSCLYRWKSTTLSSLLSLKKKKSCLYRWKSTTLSSLLSLTIKIVNYIFTDWKFRTLSSLLSEIKIKNSKLYLYKLEI